MPPIYKRKRSYSSPYVNVKKRKITSVDRYRGKKQSESGVTTQYDRVTQYSKRRMPRRKKYRWRKFCNKVGAVLDKALGTRTVVFNSTIDSFGPNTGQYISAACLYGFCGNADTILDVGFRDIWRICNNDNDIMLPGSDGVNASKITFGSGIIDFTMRNTGTSGLEVDLYEINVRTDATKEPNFTQSVNQAEINTNTIPGAAAPVFLTNRGITLFDLPNLLSQDRLSVYKKKKFFLGIGNTATHQHRDPRNHYFNATDVNLLDVNDQGSYGRRKMTQLFVFVAKAVIGSGELNVGLQVGVTRKYSYTINQSAKALDSYNPPN